MNLNKQDYIDIYSDYISEYILYKNNNIYFSN